MEIEAKPVTNNLRRLRERARLSQRALASNAKIDQAQICIYETQGVGMGYKRLRRLAKFFGGLWGQAISIDVITGDAPYPFKENSCLTP